jgi:hypothetical protein
VVRLISGSCLVAWLAFGSVAAADEPPASPSPARRIRISLDDDRTSIVGATEPRRIRLSLDESPSSPSRASVPATEPLIRTDLDATHPTILSPRPARRVRTTLD